MVDWLSKHMLPCGYKSVFGVDCPGCGFQRSFIALLKGHFIESFNFYPATIPVLVTAIFLLLEPRLRVKNVKRVKNAFYIGLASIIFISYTIKMVHLYWL